MAKTAEIEPIDDTFNRTVASVFSAKRTIASPTVELPKVLKVNKRLKMDGEEFLSLVPPVSFPVAFFDPQYRGVLDKLGYGNEGKERGKKRCSLPQMEEDQIARFIRGIDKALIPSGHLFLWIDKFHLCQGFRPWIDGTNLDIVDLVVWNKQKMGMGYRTRRVSEYLAVLQKLPRRAKGVWKTHNILDVISERVRGNGHAHEKPVDLQAELIGAVSNEGDIVIDPAAGSFSVMESANLFRRNFLGCDING